MTTDPLAEAEQRCRAAGAALSQAEPGSPEHIGLVDELLRWSERVVRLREPLPASPPPLPAPPGATLARSSGLPGASPPAGGPTASSAVPARSTAARPAPPPRGAGDLFRGGPA